MTCKTCAHCQTRTLSQNEAIASSVSTTPIRHGAAESAGLTAVCSHSAAATKLTCACQLPHVGEHCGRCMRCIAHVAVEVLPAVSSFQRPLQLAIMDVVIADMTLDELVMPNLTTPKHPGQSRA